MSRVPLHVIIPEETARLVYDQVMEALIQPFSDIFGQDRFFFHDLSVDARLASGGRVVQETIDAVASDKRAILIKGPTVTPTHEQIHAALERLSLLDREYSNTFSPLAFGSPNAYLRAHPHVLGNLLRYANPGMDALLDSKPPHYEPETPVSILYPPFDILKTRETYVFSNAGTLSVMFNGKSIGGFERYSAHSAVGLTVTPEEDMRTFLQAAVREASTLKSDMRFMSKYTVRPLTDGRKKQLYNAVREEHGLPALLGNQGDIIDSAFARLLERPPRARTLAIIPDVWMGMNIAYLVDQIKQKGLHFSESAIFRFSACKGEYGDLNFTAETDGILTLWIGKKKENIRLQKGDIVEGRTFDFRRAEAYIEQVFAHARRGGFNEVIFGFDPEPYGYAMRKALIKYIGTPIPCRLMSAAEAAAVLFCSPPDGRTAYVFDNLWGDILSDALDVGRSIASINSLILLKDGRVWVEMGSAGTAPDLLEAYKKDGYLRYNPIPMIEAFSIAFELAGEKEHNDLLTRFGKALHASFLNVLAKGSATPDLAPKLRSPLKNAVSTEEFIKAVQKELGVLVSQL